VFEISLEQGYRVLTMPAVVGAAMLLAWLAYRRAFVLLSPGRRRLLLALRWVAIVLVALLLFRPVLTYHKQLTRKPAILLAVDRSGSMSVRDDSSGASRFDQARRQVARWWTRLGDDFDLHLVAFAERAQKLSGPEELALLAPDGRSTSLSRAILAARVEVPLDRLAAVIVVSDGIHNSARFPTDAAKRLGAVVDTVGVGASLRDDGAYRDVQLAGIDCPDHLLLGNKAKITASVEAVGLAGQVIEVVLEDGHSTLDRAELTLDNIEGSQQVAFEFRPTEKGRHNYTVRAVPAADEPIVENNRRRAAALVVEPGIRVLYLEGTLRAEYGALVDRFLAKDPDLEFCAMVQTRPNVFLTRSNLEGLTLDAIPSDRETIDRFDVFILGDLDSTFLRPEQQRLIVDRVRAGAGLVMLGGYHSLGPGGYAGTPLGEILPVGLGPRDVGQITEPFLPRLTPEGARHPIFSGIAGFFPTVARDEPAEPGLPPLEGCTRIEAARADATVLAVCPGQTPTMPVLVVGPAGEGRAAVFTGDTTRRWQQTPRALGQDSPFLRFWGQMVRWLAGRQESVEAGAGVTATVDKAYYEPDEPVRISAVVRDERGEGAAGVKVTAKIRSLEDAAVGSQAPVGRVATRQSTPTITLSPTLGPAGRYETTFQPGASGAYAVEVSADLAGKILKAEQVLAEVGRSSLEFERLDLDDKMLRQIAEAGGGRYEHLTTADALLDTLDRQQSKNTMTFQRRLWYPPVIWLLLIGTLTTEWTLRRLFQLK